MFCTNCYSILINFQELYVCPSQPPLNPCGILRPQLLQRYWITMAFTSVSLLLFSPHHRIRTNVHAKKKTITHFISISQAKETPKSGIKSCLLPKNPRTHSTAAGFPAPPLVGCEWRLGTEGGPDYPTAIFRSLTRIFSPNVCGLPTKEGNLPKRFSLLRQTPGIRILLLFFLSVVFNNCTICPWVLSCFFNVVISVDYSQFVLKATFTSPGTSLQRHMSPISETTDPAAISGVMLLWFSKIARCRAVRWGGQMGWAIPPPPFSVLRGSWF